MFLRTPGAVVDDDSLANVLSEFARTLLTDFPIEGILDHLVLRIVDVLPITGAGVTLISPGTAPRYVAASNAAALHFEQLQTEIGEGPCLTAFETGAAVMIPDLRVDERYPQFTPAALAAGLAAAFTFPLHHRAERFGALDLYRDAPGALDPTNARSAQTLADVTAAYLLNAQARSDAQATSDRHEYSALHDPLTGLSNRMLLHERLGHATKRAERTDLSVAVVFIDLDDFKGVNDEYGHPIGDELLISIARRLSETARSGDTLARFSGDEFVFLCENLRNHRELDLLTRRIHRVFSEPFYLAQSGLTILIRASVGTAFAAPGTEISKELIAEADIAMYEAKRRRAAGR